jgi:toxin-antitoxin system PIN domain toxin
VIFADVNVFVYAFRVDSPRHGDYREWLAARIGGYESFGLSELVLSGVQRILTHPKIFSPPTPPEKALAFIEALRGAPNGVLLAPGPRHWGIFTHLCRTANAKGNLVADAYLAALAIEHGCEWVTTDRDFARFPGLRYRHPLD